MHHNPITTANTISIIHISFSSLSSIHFNPSI
jgi:hypothetical protein